MVVWCAGWLVAVSCTLWDTFFDHPASVYTGSPKILAHRAQAWGSRGIPPVDAAHGGIGYYENAS